MTQRYTANLSTFLIVLLLLPVQSIFSQDKKAEEKPLKFHYIEVESHFGAFLQSDDPIGNSGALDNGYGGLTVKYAWQPTDPEGWAAGYSYPSYGLGFYVGYLSDVNVFGRPNAIFGFIDFPLSSPERRNQFGIATSVGLTYSLNPYDVETNPYNNAIGARMAVYFNLDLGFTYKLTRELDMTYGFDFAHYSNGSTFKPNSGLNLYGLNLGMRYHYTGKQRNEKDFFAGTQFTSRFKRPTRSERHRNKEDAISLYLAGGVAQSDANAGTDTLYGVGTVVFDLEHRFGEMHGMNGGFDVFWDNRLRELETSDRMAYGVHLGYDFMFYKFTIKFQLGTYLGDQKGKGNFFMRPALRYDLSKRFFAQVGLKTLNGGAADYIEYGIGFKPFKW